MVKTKANNGSAQEDTKGLKDEVKKALGGGRADFVWIRDDGAVCFGDECLVLKPGQNDTLDLQIKPDRCGRDAGPIIINHLIKSAGRGVNIRIPPIEEE